MTGLELAAGLLALKALTGKPAPISTPPPAAAPPPSSGGNIAGTIGGVVGAGVSALGSVFGGGSIAGTTTGTAATAATTSTAAAAATATESSLEASLFSASLGAAEYVYGGALAVAVVAVIVINAVNNAIQLYKAAVASFLGYDVRAGSLDQLKLKFKTIEIQPTQTMLLTRGLSDSASHPTVATLQTSLPAATVQKVVATCIYLALERAAARNQGLYNFFKSLGETDQHITDTGAAMPPDVWAAFVDEYLRGGYGPTAGARYVDSGIEHVSGSQICVLPYYQWADLVGIAQTVLGVDYQRAVSAMRFGGIAMALSTAAIAGFSFFWPGDQTFVAELCVRVGMGLEIDGSDDHGYPAQSTHHIEGAAPYTTFTAWWVKDTATGLLVAPISCRDTNTLIASLGAP